MGKPDFVTLFWISLNVFSSVSIILLNKFLLRSCHCGYALTLTAMHFVCNHLFQALLSFLGFADFHPPAPENSLNFEERIRLGFLGSLSIASLNLSLLYNSVSLYQIFKLLCIPCMLLIQPSQLSILNTPMLISLAFLMIGIFMSTIQELTLETSTLGLILATTGVVTTSLFQLKSAELTQGRRITGVQMNGLQALPTAFFVFLAAFTVELHPSMASSALYHPFSFWDIFLVISTCVISLAVNISSYGVLGKTTAVTFQVLGQMKTICVLIGGWILFVESRAQINMQTIIGILLAVVSAGTYSVLKQNVAAKPTSDAAGAGAGAGSSSSSAVVMTKDGVPAPPEEIQLDIRGNLKEIGPSVRGEAGPEMASLLEEKRGT